MRPVLVGIAGGSGSGKTTLASALCKHLGDATLVAHDSYYHDLAHLEPEQRAGRNFDHPASLDSDLLASHLAHLRLGGTVQVPVYDFTTHTRTGEHRPVVPSRVIVVDGVLLYTHPGVVSLLDHRVFIDVGEQTRLQRRIARDVSERGRSEESVRAQFRRTVEPMHRAFVAPSRSFAHQVVTADDELDSVCAAIATSVEALRARRRPPSALTAARGTGIRR